MRVVVPFGAETPKTRLADALGPSERSAFARAMLRDVLSAIRASGHEPEVLATSPVDVDAPVTVDDRPLTDAVNAVLANRGCDCDHDHERTHTHTHTHDHTHDDPIAIVMADLALATQDALGRLFGAAAAGEIVLVPGRGGGTNALVVRHPEFRVDYHNGSIRDHREIAARIGASVTEVDSYRLATDIDEPADLVEVLLHGNGAAYEWLVDAEFEVTTEQGRVDVTRSELRF